MNGVLLAAVVLAITPLDTSVGDAVVRLHVWPMPAPKPALKYQLLPELRELNPGNATQYYLRCFAEQRNFFFSKEATIQRARYRAMPLAELAAEKLRDYGGFALRQADWAARLDTADWQLLRHVQTEGLDLMLPELERLKILGAALQVRFRAEVAGHRFDDAIRTAKTMFALARHLGEYPRQSANLLGISIADQALGTLEEMVQQRGCPNLYWALTDLPSPLVDLRKGVQGDRTQMAADLRLLRNDVPMTEEELEKLVSHFSGVLGFTRAQAGQAPRSLRALLAARVQDPERVRAARNRLMESGCLEDMARKFPPLEVVARDFLPSWLGHSRLVQNLPPLQIILLDERREYEARWDDSLKLLALPPWQIDALSVVAWSPDHATTGPGCCGDEVFADFLPRLMETRRVQARLEQRIGLLRHVEALRLYAAEHEGRLPGKLTEVTVPLSPDPFSGKPFDYRLEAATGHLRGSLPRGREQSRCFNAHYELTIQK